MDIRIKNRREWIVGRSIVDGRSTQGQITWKGIKKGKGHVFLLRLGKDAARQVVGTAADAVRALEKLSLELAAGTYTPPDRKIKFGTFLREHYLPWKRPSLKPHTYGVYEDTVLRVVVPALGRNRVSALTTKLIQDWVDGFG